MAQELVLNEEKLMTLGQRLFGTWETHKKDRLAAENRWLQNLRQFRGIYDPEILKMIPNDRSKAYPKVTRWKLIGTVARLMQMLFPQTEKNYGLKPSPMPNLSIAQLQEVLDDVVAKKAKAEQIEEKDVVCKDEDIEQAIFEYAKHKAGRMELKLDDDMQEMEYITLARKVVFSACLYNIGVLKGPMHKRYKVRTWKKDLNTGRYVAQEVDKVKPLLEFLPVWNYYPDMSAKSLDHQDGQFERHVMTRRQVEELAERPDFLQAPIKAWLAAHTTGNHIPEHWETELAKEPKGDKNNVNQGDGRKYVVIAYWGDITGHDLAAAGNAIAEADLGKTYHGNVWMIDNSVIKAKVSLMKGEVREHHVFVFEEDDLSLLGNGQCDTLRDSQLSICESARMALDEASVGGENLEVNIDMLTPGHNTDQRSYKVWKREGEGAVAGYPAVRPVQRQNRLSELMNMVQMFLEFANNESGLPPPSMGDVSGGGSEALRTQGGASMFLGAASLPIRDTVRNFDSFTISVITALVKWNMRFDPADSRDGDFDCIARGSTSLIAKEVLAQSLDVFSTTLTDEERAHVKTRKLLEARAKARDIPTEELFESEETANANIAALRQSQQKTQDAALEEMTATVQEKIANAIKRVAEAKKADASVTIDTMAIILEALTNGGDKGRATSAGAEGTSA